jgi:hypothetical protein
MTHAELPAIRKKIIYLDTSIVSHMARAKARSDEASPYYQLYVALKTAVARNLIVCPGSTIVDRGGDDDARRHHHRNGP